MFAIALSATFSLAGTVGTAPRRGPSFGPSAVSVSSLAGAALAEDANENDKDKWFLAICIAVLAATAVWAETLPVEYSGKHFQSWKAAR